MCMIGNEAFFLGSMSAVEGLCCNASVDVCLHFLSGGKRVEASGQLHDVNIDLKAFGVGG